MGLKKWKISDYDKALAKELAAECDIDPIVALIASSRGYYDPMELEQFLSDDPYFTDPAQMSDIILAAEIINAVIDNGEKIAIYGDYDCDGVVATTLLYSYLVARQANCIYYIPDRFTEGYGMNCDAVKQLSEQGVKLIITVDNGIKCFNEINLANELGITVVVTDHHLPEAELPKAAAVVDPHRKDCLSAFKDICGAQVVFRLICVIENKEPEELLPLYADILSLAVIADVMPITLENRSIVKFGIEKLRTAPSTGISALMNVAGIKQSAIDDSKIAFGLTPRINAAGRMGSAKRAVELLLSDNMLSALQIANEIDDANIARQVEEKKIISEAVNIIEKSSIKYNRVIVVDAENWHHGVIGIVSAKLTERYGVPTILLSRNGDFATGSGRSIEGFPLYDAIKHCEDLLLRFGGHEQAAGITLSCDNIEEFRKKINRFAFEREYIAPTLNIDCKLNPTAISIDLAFALQTLAPYGNGNKEPIFAVCGVTLQRITPIGNNKHLRLLFSKGENAFQALLFGVSAEAFCFAIGDTLDIAVNIESNYFRDEYSVSVKVISIRPSNIDDNVIFSELCAYNDYFSEIGNDYKMLLPSREDVGVIYKYISEKPVLAERVKYAFINEIGYAKTMIAIKTLEELELILRNDTGLLMARVNAVKTALTNSKTYADLFERSSSNE